MHQRPEREGGTGRLPGRSVLDGPPPPEPPTVRADRGTVVRALTDVARLGPFFAVTEPGPGEVDGAVWRPLRELDPPAVHALIDDCAGRFGLAEQRVAASLLFQGLATRLWSPVVAAAAVHGVVPELSELRWRWPPGAPIALWLPDSDGLSVHDPAEPVRRTVVDGHLRPLAEKIRRVARVSEGLLWGNAASALAGTLHAVRPGRTEWPELTAPVAGLVRRLLAMEPLAGTGTLRPDGSFVRRGCCLYYRVPPGGAKCGDCVLLHPPRGKSGF